jgi:hypothetical protein
VKTERIQTDSSETVFVTIFFGFVIGADSVRIQIRNQSLSVTNTDRIWSEYGSAADKQFVDLPVNNEVKLAYKFFYIHKYIFI